MFKKILAGLIVMSIVFIPTVRSEEKINATWKTCPDNYEYKSKGFSCRINKSGSIHKLTANGWQLIDKAFIYTRMKTKGSSKKVRVFQYLKKALNIKIKEDGENLFLKANGILGVKGGANVAKFTEEIYFSPTKIDFSYEVTTTTETNMDRWMPFCSLLTNKIAPFTECALEAFDTKKETGIYEIPKVYIKRKTPWSSKLKKAKFIKNKEFSISIPESENTYLSVADGRCWKANNIEIIIRPPMLCQKNSNGFYPAGSAFKWSFSLGLNNN
jgi:hypothetical protein